MGEEAASTEAEVGAFTGVAAVSTEAEVGAFTEVAAVSTEVAFSRVAVGASVAEAGVSTVAVGPFAEAATAAVFVADQRAVTTEWAAVRTADSVDRAA